MRPNEALNEITSIREKLELLESRQSLRSWSIALSGCAFMAAGIWMSVGQLPELSTHTFVLRWTGIFFVCSLIILGELAWRSQNELSRMTFSWTRQLIKQLVPFSFAGVMIAVAAEQQNNALVWLPGIWAIVMGLGLYSSSQLLPNTSQIAAGWLILSGSVAAAIPELSLDYPNLVMAGTFGVGQLVLAASLYWGGQRNG